MPKRTSRITGPTYGTRARHHHCMSSFGRPETLAYNLIEVKGLRGVHFCSYRAQCYYGHQTWTVKSRLAGQSAQGTDRWSPPLWIEVASFLLQVQEKLVLEGLGDLGPLDGIWRRQPSADLLEALFLQGVHWEGDEDYLAGVLWLPVRPSPRGSRRMEHFSVAHHQPVLCHGVAKNPRVVYECVHVKHLRPRKNWKAKGTYSYMCYMRMQTVAIEHWVRESAALDNYSMHILLCGLQIWEHVPRCLELSIALKVEQFMVCFANLEVLQPAMESGKVTCA